MVDHRALVRLSPCLALRLSKPLRANICEEVTAYGTSLRNPKEGSLDIPLVSHPFEKTVHRYILQAGYVDWMDWLNDQYDEEHIEALREQCTIAGSNSALTVLAGNFPRNLLTRTSQSEAAPKFLNCQTCHSAGLTNEERTDVASRKSQARTK